MIIDTDWSRKARSYFKTLSASKTSHKITEYIPIVNQIDKLILENKQLSTFINSSLQTNKPSQVIFNSAFLQKLYENSVINASRKPNGHRHNEIIIKFSISLFIWSGPIAYEFLHRNMPAAIPSISLIRNKIHSQYRDIPEGMFRFDELVLHLQRFKCPFVVSISEDATRIITRVEYDSSNDQCVGFVLPIRDGMIQCRAYEATSFDTITEMFKTRPLSKFAYVYVAQPLSDEVPSFCLARIGTDNKFDYQSILFRWKYIFSELKKRSIQVINFSSDGDSRLLKAMLIMLSLQKEPTFDTSTLTSENKLPSQWVDWYILPRLSLFSISQDTVHLGVKLKARLMKPGILLPLGVYVASAADLKMVFEHYGKEVHNIRMKDLDHRDRQNFDAVDHLTSEAVTNLLDQCGCLGTKVYLKMIRYIIDSFLCKDLEPKKRIIQRWIAVFFFRYWRQWILDNSEHNLKNNFITRNAYLCAEINSHCLISFLLECKSVNLPFMPWLLGSQPCEQLFRATRNMSSVYSTMINFSMLGLLRRLHRIHIQSILEAEGEENGIVFPRREQHQRKHRKAVSTTQKLQNDVSAVTMEDIEDWVEIGKAEAKNLLELLGMDVLLRSNKHWNEVNAGINAVESISTKDLIDEDEPEDDCEDAAVNIDVELQEEQADGLEDDIKCLQENGGILDRNAAHMHKILSIIR